MKSNTNPHPSHFILFVGAFLFLTFIKYGGNGHYFYMDLFQHLLNPGSYPNDIFIQKSFVFKSSPWFSIVQYFRIDLDNDFVGYFWQILLATISLVAFTKTLKKFFAIEHITTIYVIILATIFLDSYRLIEGPYSGLICEHSCTQTQIAFQLSFVFIYLLLTERFLWASLALSVILLLTLKTYWILWPIGILYIMRNQELKKTPIIYFCIPIVLVAINRAFNNVSSLSATKLQLVLMCQNILSRDGNEDAFHLQSKAVLFALALSFIVFFVLMKRFNDKISTFFSSVFLISFANCIAGGFYAWKGYLVYPNPVLILLSPVRSMSFYVFCFYLILGIVFLKSKVHEIFKTTLIVFFIIYVHLFRNPHSVFFLIGLYMLLIVLLFDGKLRQVMVHGIDILCARPET